MAALLGWETGKKALVVLIPTTETNLMMWCTVFSSSLLMFVLAGFSLAHPWMPEKRPDSILIRSERGEVTIPLSVIEDYLQREALRIPGVNHLRLRTGCLDGFLVFHTEAYVTDQVSIPGIIEELQNFMEHESRDVIGLKKVGPVHVTIKRISNDTRPVPLPMLAHQAGLDTERCSQSSHS